MSEKKNKKNEEKARMSLTLSQDVANELRKLKNETKIPISELVEMHFTNPAKYALLIRDFLEGPERIENEQILKTIEKLLLTMGVDKKTIKESMKKIEESIR
ncbi:hypothetical protein AKJ37_04255 [candidate division MSBL1 archaeon SCGC-AAA259I09]|uniref:Predicted DNA-binding protein ribbon-helix-helix domain-containing protein n=1 Tax=candidate division MSBL1 archaeon SCGC-AAA259I09 TaxID=1698267 RepID=A0A133URN0_9EURY|nr:hypothetical protein AKJ37_04255 [candidate division MSBL1 archaeon SCGC-AAA259I09]